VSTLVLTHIDKLGSTLDGLDSSVAHSLRLANEGYNCTVCSLTWINIQELNALRSLDYASNLLDSLHIAALREVGHALDNSFLHSF
jgi:hypothetical protein